MRVGIDALRFFSTMPPMHHAPKPLSSAASGSSQDALARARGLVRREMEAVDACILKHLQSDVAMIPAVGRYIVEAGGKRLRPLVLLLAARLVGGAPTERLAPLAAAVEFIHTASLLHDDVVDAAELRRGMPSANGVWGDHASVLVGDFLFSRAFELLVADGDPAILARMARATNRLAEGEVLELAKSFHWRMREEECLEVMERKTAVLFEAAGAVGALAAGHKELADALASYGAALGIAFQLVDDALDYTASAHELGKPVLHDLAEGKITMPLVLAMEEDEALAARVREIAARGRLSSEEAEWVGARVRAARGVQKTLALAQRFAQKAERALPAGESQARAALVALARFAVSRSF